MRTFILQIEKSFLWKIVAPSNRLTPIYTCYTIYMLSYYVCLSCRGNNKPHVWLEYHRHVAAKCPASVQPHDILILLSTKGGCIWRFQFPTLASGWPQKGIEIGFQCAAKFTIILFYQLLERDYFDFNRLNRIRYLLIVLSIKLILHFGIFFRSWN